MLFSIEQWNSFLISTLVALSLYLESILKADEVLVDFLQTDTIHFMC